ncbi:MAG TPA: hypothetical protein VD884_15110 [Ohtaekwangia sp.]|nr:hypothetical protein [Ohtaekwangia sp.]
MRITTFKITYGGYLSHSYELSKQDNILRYVEFNQFNEVNVFDISFTGAQWTDFVGNVISIIQHWKTEYLSDILDGTQWEVQVEADGTLYSIYGSNAWPPDYIKLAKLIREITGKDFAERFEDDLEVEY